MARPRLVVDDGTAAEMRRLRAEDHLSQGAVAKLLGVTRWIVRTRLGESGSAPRQIAGQARLAQVDDPPRTCESRAYAGCGCEGTADQGCLFR